MNQLYIGVILVLGFGSYTLYQQNIGYNSYEPTLYRRYISIRIW